MIHAPAFLNQSDNVASALPVAKWWVDRRTAKRPVAAGSVVQTTKRVAGFDVILGAAAPSLLYTAILELIATSKVGNPATQQRLV